MLTVAAKLGDEPDEVELDDALLAAFLLPPVAPPIADKTTSATTTHAVICAQRGHPRNLAHQEPISTLSLARPPEVPASYQSKRFSGPGAAHTGTTERTDVVHV